MCNSTALTLTNYDILDLLKKEEIKNAVTIITQQLSQGHITSIVNAFANNTVILPNGWVYFKVKSLNTMLRTGNSGVERALVYRGVPNVIKPSEISEINGEDYVSQFDLISLIRFRLTNAPTKSVDLYLKITLEIYENITTHQNVQDLNQLFIQKVQANRSKLKSDRIDEYNITHCEFTGEVIMSTANYQFAHLDAVAYYPSKALDINNGVIIHKDIHSEMTNLGLNTAESIYEHCEKKGYSTDWAGV